MPAESKTHHLGHEAIHTYFDRDLPPRLMIAPGDTVVFETREASYGRVARTFASEPAPDVPDDLAAIITASAYPEDAAAPRGHPLTGPIAISSAAPGDTLLVTIVAVQPAAWGWTGARPGGGLLGDEIAAPAIHYWDLRAGDRTTFAPGIVVPLEPFCGVMGVAPAEPGQHATTPPRASGGNMDIRQLTAGSVLSLPVMAPGALFSVGDAHATQGDGEVSGTAIECDATVTLRFDLRRGEALAGPQFQTAGPVAARTDTGPHFAATGHASDLYQAAQDALRGVLDYLEQRHGLSRSEACILASVCVSLRISQIVNGGVYTVTALLPLSIFAPDRQAVR